MNLTPLLMPDVGAAALPVQVSVWLIEEGDRFHEGDRIVEVLASGMTFDVPASHSGRLIRIERFPGTPVATGDCLAQFEAYAEADDDELGADPRT